MPHDNWNAYQDQFARLTNARATLVRDIATYEADIKHALFAGGMDTAAALSLVEFLNAEESIALHAEVLEVALSVHGQTTHARSILANMERRTVLEACSAIIHSEAALDYERVACMIELLVALDAAAQLVQLARRVAAARIHYAALDAASGVDETLGIDEDAPGSAAIEEAEWLAGALERAVAWKKPVTRELFRDLGTSPPPWLAACAEAAR